MKTKLLGIGSFVAVGLFCLYAAWWRWQDTIALDRRAARTSGVIVAYEFSTRVGAAGPGRPGLGGDHTRTEKTRLLVVEFALPDGRKIRFNSSVWLPDGHRDIGTTVPVIYRREQPAQAQIYDRKSRVGAPLLLLGLGLAALVGAAFGSLLN